MSDELRDLRKQFASLKAAFEKVAGEGPTMSFGEYAKRWLEQQMASPALRGSTKRAKEYQYRRNLGPAFDDIPLDKIGNANWNQWVKKMQEANAQAKEDEHKQITRFFNARKTLTEILHAARKDGLIDRVPELDDPDEARNVGRVLTDQEMAKILRKTTYRIFRIFFWTLYRMGCRPREILQWEWSFFEWKEPGHTWINIPSRISKTGRTRKIAVNRRVSALLYRQFKKGPRSRFVFPNRIHPDRPQLSYHGAWATATRKAGLSAHAVPYDTRRTFITNAVAKNKPAVYIGKQLDTSTKQIEQTYAKSQQEVMEGIVDD